jgi:L-alanine-DL-glutamate epimerase-like enolase superfamily enzyme
VRIARGRQTAAELVEVELAWNGLVGIGEGAPTGRYGESAATALRWLEEAAPLLGDDPDDLALWTRLPVGQQAARAALDAALHDLSAKKRGRRLRDLLGLPVESPPTSRTISLADPDEMARAAEQAARGFSRLKLKLGGQDGLDVARVRAVQAAVEIPLQVDVNEAWSFDEARDVLPQLNVDLVEQPLRAGDPEGPKLKEASPVPVFVDEDCSVAEDVPQCVPRAHGVVVKLAKSGGIREALRTIEAARDAGLQTMIGCMAESTLGIVAASHVAGVCDFVDLDGNLFVDNDPWRLDPDAPGLGVVPRRLGRRERGRQVFVQVYRRARLVARERLR